MQIIKAEDGSFAFRISKEEINALIEYASEEDRPALKCAWFDVSNMRMWATDGHQLAVAYAGEAPDEVPEGIPPWHVGLSSLLTAVKAGKGHYIFSARKVYEADKPKEFKYIVSIQLPSGHTLTVEHEVLTPVPVDQVIPTDLAEMPSDNPQTLKHDIEEGTKWRGVPHGINPVLLAATAAVQKACDYKGRSAISAPVLTYFPPSHPLSPIVGKMRSSNDGTLWTLVLMPARV